MDKKHSDLEKKVIQKIFLLKWLPAIFIRKIPQKLLAIIFGIVIWFFVGNQNPLEITEYQLSIPVSYINIPKTLAVTNKLIENINIRVTAQKSAKSSIKPSNFQAIVNLQKVKEGENEIQLDQSSIQSDANYKLLSLLPNSLSVNTERVAEKNLPIKVIVAGDLGDKVISQITKKPDFVLVKGAFSVISSLQYIETQPVAITSATPKQDFVVALNIPQNISLLAGIENVAGTISLGDKAINIRLEDIPVFAVGSNFEVRSNPKKMNFLISGPQNIVSSINKDELKAYIRLNDYKPGKYVIKDVNLNLPSEVIIKTAWPPINIWILNNKIQP